MPNSHEHLSSQLFPGEVQDNDLLRPQTEVKETLQTNEERLLELLGPPAEKVGELCAQFSEITGQALATTVNPHDRETLKISANIIGWRLFSEPGDPLPFGLVQGRAADGSLGVLYDTRTGFGATCAKAAEDKLNAVGLDEINENLTALMDERSTQIKEVFSNIVETSQAYRFINALAGGGMPQQPEEQPLTPFWRAIQETQVGQQVRRRWGLEPQEQIVPHTEPDYDLRRELSRVADETSPRREKPEADPLSRLRSYLGSLVQAEFTRVSPNKAFIGFERDEDGDRIIRTAETDYGDPTNYIQRAVRKKALEINESGPHVQAITEEWLYYLTESILWPQEESPGFMQLSKSAIDKAWDYLDFIIKDGRKFRSKDYHPTTSTEGTLHAGLVNPRSPYSDLSQLNSENGDHHNHYSSSQSSAELNNPPDKDIGEVLRFTPNACGQNACRLIQSEPMRGDLPPLRGDEELVIRLFGREFERAQPYIPGYHLVGNTGDAYGFVPDEMGDPYASADIQLTAEQRYTLASQYAEIGLRKLARVVERKSRLTVQGLASLISEKSMYVTLTEAKKLNPPLKATVYLSKLESFRELVRDSSLRVQCTGAAQFLRFSLEEMFGKGTAATTSGYHLSRRTVSTSSDHEQTVFMHQGQTYLLDATPSSTQATSYNDYLFRGMRKWFRRPSFPLAASKMVQIDLRIPPAERILDQPEPREQKIQTIRQSLEAQLMGLMQVPDKNAVYERIVALPIGDPFRTTVEVTLRATYGETTRDEVERLHRYLVNYQEADEVLRRQMGVSSYDDQVVQALQSATEQLLGHH